MMGWDGKINDLVLLIIITEFDQNQKPPHRLAYTHGTGQQKQRRERLFCTIHPMRTPSRAIPNPTIKQEKRATIRSIADPDSRSTIHPQNMQPAGEEKRS
jgi:hypothetical protein